MKKISKDELVGILSLMKGSTIGRVDYDVDAKLKKTDNPYRDEPVMKFVSLSAGFGWDYNTRPEKQMAREGLDPNDWEAEGRKWGTRINRFLVEHTNKAGEHNFYLTVHPIQPLAESVYHIGDKVLDKADIAPYIPPTSHSAKQEDAGIEKEIIYRDVKVDGIRKLVMDGEEYIIE